ncbi:hypothetical protein CLOSBL3_11647 [Clostridiaceae bacterium BL-3]|nr:hypothetical protein CLOSBL3_11647 [Clostridiaceae bacterium BL-3]
MHLPGQAGADQVKKFAQSLLPVRKLSSKLINIATISFNPIVIESKTC